MMSMEQTYRDTVAHLSVQLMKHHKHHEAIDNDLKMAGFPTDGTMLTRLESLRKALSEADDTDKYKDQVDKLNRLVAAKESTIRVMDVRVKELQDRPRNLDQAGVGKLIRDELETKIRVRDNENRILQNQVQDLTETNEGLRHEIGQLRDALEKGRKGVWDFESYYGSEDSEDG